MGLQEDFLDAFFSTSQTFFLTGGSALNLFYFHHRVSEDLDCFTTDPEEFRLINGIMEQTCVKIGASYNIKQDFPDFKRFYIIRQNEAIVVDCVNERVAQIYPDKKMFWKVRVDVLPEMTVNKLCALLGRMEYKDLIDLYVLQEHGYLSLDYLSDATKKDGGLSPATLAFVLNTIDLEKMPDAFASTVPKEKLDKFRRSLVDSLLHLAFPEKSV